MRFLFSLLLLGISTGGLGACSGASRVAPNGYPIVPRDSVEAHEGLGAIAEPFEVIELITLERMDRSTARTVVVSVEELERLPRRTTSPDADGSGMDATAVRRRLSTARREAGRLGANGLLIATLTDLDADERIRRAVWGRLDEDQFVFIAIYIGPPPQASGV